MEMTSKQLKDLLERVGQTQVGMARILGISDRTMRRYIAGELPVPRVVEIAVRCLADHSGLRHGHMGESKLATDGEAKR